MITADDADDADVETGPTRRRHAEVRCRMSVVVSSRSFTGIALPLARLRRAAVHEWSEHRRHLRICEICG